MHTPKTAKPPPDQLPFVAPCRDIGLWAPLRWLKLGYRDMIAAPRLSLAYGLLIMLLSYGVSALAYVFGNYVLLFVLLSGFVFVGPVIAIGLYEISRSLARGQTPALAEGWHATRSHLGNTMIFALVLLIIFLVWVRAGSMVHAFFPPNAEPQLKDLALFLGIGSAVGSIFAVIVFSASAFSLPMMADRKVDAITAVITSVNAVLRNKLSMVVWIVLIVAAVGLSFATLLVGLGFLMPLIGHATWHAYVETIDAGDWPLAE